MVSRGGSARFHRECVGSAERLYSVMALLDFDSHLEFDECIARQRGNPDGSPYVPRGFTQKLDEQIRSAIDDFGGVGKARNRVDVAVDADNSLNFVERTKMALQNRQLRERTGAGGRVSLRRQCGQDPLFP